MSPQRLTAVNLRKNSNFSNEPLILKRSQRWNSHVYGCWSFSMNSCRLLWKCHVLNGLTFAYTFDIFLIDLEPLLQLLLLNKADVLSEATFLWL